MKHLLFSAALLALTGFPALADGKTHPANLQKDRSVTTDRADTNPRPMPDRIISMDEGELI